LKEAKNILGLQLQISILKYEIEELKQIKNNLQHTKNNYTLETLSEINRNYPKYRI
jgi:FtsZ-binding cell division protein ZapB